MFNGNQHVQATGHTDGTAADQNLHDRVVHAPHHTPRAAARAQKAAEETNEAKQDDDEGKE